MDDRKMKSSISISTRLVLLLALVSFVVILADTASSQEPQWIWSPKLPVAQNTNDSQGECYYRKKFTLVRPEKAELTFAAGDEFEIYINGQLASRGQSYGSANKLDVSELFEPGVNLIAAKVRHNSSQTIGLAVKLRIKEVGETRWRSLNTDTTWKTRTGETVDWKKSSHNDMGWLKATSLGTTALIEDQVAVQNSSIQDAIKSNTRLAGTTGSTPVTQISGTSIIKKRQSGNQTDNQATESGLMTPQKNAESGSQTVSPSAPQTTKRSAGKTDERFKIDPEFVVQTVLSPEETGSLIAMEINEFGHLLLSKEGGPLLIADPTKPQGHPARIRVYCSEVNTCQGILPLNGNVYVTGQGPQGLGLYLLVDTNRDGVLEVTKKLVGFTGKLGEHGPHGLRLGPDGMLYVIIGNGSQLDKPVAETSPYKNYYEGDLVERYEDPGGHAEGVKVPGGTIVRMTLDGSKAELVAGGIRNAYDLVFDDRGELFVHDSDMESDMGTTWYRPTFVFHVPDGAEMGWRSGWAKFPQHYIDQTPAICETGRGSPTGAVLYQHMQFPVRYQNTLFLADWSEGRILALRKQPSGAGFVAQPEVFLSGKPLNVCDLAIAEDGGLYFCTGGRGTAGGVYRVVWNGSVPDKMLEFESDLARVIRHPQPDSAWARQSIAELKKELGADWETSITGVAMEKRNPAKFRIRALNLMVLFGPAPSDESLTALAKDRDAEIRAKAARLCGLKADATSTELLTQLISDDHPLVRRVTCESMMRLGIEPDYQTLIPMLKSTDRIESQSARRMLERIPVEQWQTELLGSEDKRVFINSAVALLTANPTLEHSYQILAQAAQFMDGFVNDADFIDLLRTMQLALVRGEVQPERVPGLSTRIGNEFPSGSSIINHELAKLMAYLKVGNLNGRISEYLMDESVSLVDRVHAAMYFQTVGGRLSDDARLTIVDCLESGSSADGVGGSYQPYLKRAVENAASTMTADQVNTVLQNGSRWPNAVLAAFYKMPDKMNQEMVEQVIELDRSLQNKNDSGSQQVRLGVIAILARSGGARSMEYLRELWQNEESRRNDIVIGLAQSPDGENWAYLVTSLPTLDDLTSREVIQKLAKISRRPREPKFFRDVLEAGYRLRDQGAIDSVRLLEHWSGKKLNAGTDNWQANLEVWRNWFQTQWPEQAAIVTENQDQKGRYSINDVLGYVELNGLGDARRGQHLFESTQCSKCHRMGTVGQNMGPDLTNLSQRFSLREIVEATVDASKSIPDRYASKIVMTVSGQQFNGMTVKQSDGGLVVLQSDGRRVRVAADAIEEIRESEVSAMPNGLLNQLEMSEVADLMAFLMDAKPELAEKDVEESIR